MKQFKPEFHAMEGRHLCLRLFCGDTKLTFCPEGFRQDSLRDMIQAIAAIWNKKRDDIVVTWDQLPSLFDFRFLSKENLLTLLVEEYPKRRRVGHEKVLVFECCDNREQMCLKFWRALRKLQTQISHEEFALSWKHPFPIQELNLLTRLIKASS